MVFSKTKQIKVNSRKRVKRAIAFGNPDRVPISHAVLPDAIPV